MITIISGTNRPHANARIIADIYAGLLHARGVESRILDLIQLPQDFILTALYKNTGLNEEFNELTELLEKSEKIIFIIPEYNNSFPGVLKAFIDGLAYPNALRHKKAALVGISTGTQGGAIAISHFTDVLHYLGVHVLATKPRLMFIHKNLSEGKLTNPLYLQLLQEQADQFISF